MDEKKVVKEEVTTSESLKEDKNPVEKEVKEETSPLAPGSKTNSELLLKSLQEEREKRRKLEEEKAALEEQLQLSSTLSDEEYSDEGKALKEKIQSLSDKITSLEEKNTFEKLYATYPVLKEKTLEFEEFRKENPRTKLENVAKLYLAENGFFETPRKGLEKLTGGKGSPTSAGMTAEDVKTLRETNFKKYQDMLIKGQIKFE